MIKQAASTDATIHISISVGPKRDDDTITVATRGLGQLGAADAHRRGLFWEAERLVADLQSYAQSVIDLEQAKHERDEYGHRRPRCCLSTYWPVAKG